MGTLKSLDMPPKGNVINVSSVKKDGTRKDRSPNPDARASVSETIQNFESQEIAQPEKKMEKPEPTPTEKLLMEIKESNDRTAEAVREEINGLKTTVAKSEERLTEQISGIKETIESNAREFRNEIARIDKRIDQEQSLTNNLIENA